MNVGTKSLLFGVHHVLWHPLTVWLAWKRLYGWPSWREMICIIVHDWGYWGSPNMDGPEGEDHPTRSAMFGIVKLLGDDAVVLVARHSRQLSRALGVEPSRLCWADKLSIRYEPCWFYLLRARLSGELFEYRQKGNLYIATSSSHGAWFRWVRAGMIKAGESQRADAMSYNSSVKEQA